MRRLSPDLPSFGTSYVNVRDSEYQLLRLLFWLAMETVHLLQDNLISVGEFCLAAEGAVEVVAVRKFDDILMGKGDSKSQSNLEAEQGDTAVVKEKKTNGPITAFILSVCSLFRVPVPL
jgi:hypothetical protein